MNKLYKPLRGDYCIACDTNRVLECYTKFGKPINYTSIIDKVECGNMNFIDTLNKVEITDMRCRKCKTEYYIDWRLGYPLPIRDTFIFTLFLNHIY
ncbi:MAG: hypothetical protein ACRCXT_06195 [Paraclostridium sp.]